MAIARHQRDRRGEVAARAVAADGDPGGVDAEIGRVARGPKGCRVRVLGRGRELVLGRQPVVDRHHHASRAVGDRATRRVVGVETADDPTPAVEVDERGERRRGRVLRPVDAHGNRAFGAGHGAVLHACHGLRVGGQRRDHALDVGACFRARHRLDAGERLVHGVHEHLRNRVQRHCEPPRPGGGAPATRTARGSPSRARPGCRP